MMLQDVNNAWECEVTKSQDQLTEGTPFYVFLVGVQVSEGRLSLAFSFSKW